MKNFYKKLFKFHDIMVVQTQYNLIDQLTLSSQNFTAIPTKNII